MSENRSRTTAARPQQRSGQRPPQQGQRRPQNKRRRRRRANIRFFIFLVIVALLAVGGGILVYKLTSGNDDVSTNNPGTVTSAAQPTAATAQTTEQGTDVLADTGSPEDVIHAPVLSEGAFVQVDDLKINPDLDPNWLNVLLLGSDARKPNEPYRTDTMIICSINKQTGEVKLASLLRDTAMYFGDVGSQSGTYRMNVACYVGGPEYLMRFLNENLGLNIQYYAMVDFNSFFVIANQLGGVDIDVSQAEMEEINKNLVHQAKAAHAAGMTEDEVYATFTYLENYGEGVHLDGPQTLAYARIRKLDSDSMRTERQRKVLAALLDKLRTRTPQEVMSLAMSMGSYVTTNLSIDDIITVALTVVTNDLEVEQLRLPINGTYKQETRNEQSMLYDTDWEANKVSVYSFIYK